MGKNGLQWDKKRDKKTRFSRLSNCLSTCLSTSKIACKCLIYINNFLKVDKWTRFSHFVRPHVAFWNTYKFIFCVFQNAKIGGPSAKVCPFVHLAKKLHLYQALTCNFASGQTVGQIGGLHFWPRFALSTLYNLRPRFDKLYSIAMLLCCPAQAYGFGKFQGKRSPHGYTFNLFLRCHGASTSSPDCINYWHVLGGYLPLARRTRLARMAETPPAQFYPVPW